MRQALTPVNEWFQHVGKSLGLLWRRSLQLRVIVSTLTLSLIVIMVLGVVLTSQITDRLLDAKIAAGVEEMDRVRNTVETQLTGVHDITSQQQRLTDARESLSNRRDSSRTGGEAGSFDSALSMIGGTPQQVITAGPMTEVPDALRRFVQRNQVSYQFATVADPDGYHGRALIIGSPSAEVPTLEIYLIFPLGNEERSLALMRGTMLVGGVVLLILLAAITALVTRQVVLPIRSAARIAGRFADGRLKERMLVRGDDDIARLAKAFNEMAESLSNQINQLEEFGNLQRRFTSDVSHELRTPLTTVRMAADLIHGSSDDLDPALARSAELLVTELDRFEGLLNDLLEISRHDAGVAELQVESLDVRMCVRAAISTVRHLARDAATEVVIDLPEEPVVAEVDPRRVERVLRNLLANAIDHSEGKPVLIRMRGDTEANALAVVVRDQGVGLRPGEEKLVFSRFWRSDPSRMRRSGGTGLGLSISVEDANLHDGRLEAWGRPGVGASFRLTLPLVRGQKLGKSPLPLEPGMRRAPRPPDGDGDRTSGERVELGPPVTETEPWAPRPAVAPEAAPPASSAPGATADSGTAEPAPAATDVPVPGPDPDTAASTAPESGAAPDGSPESSSGETGTDSDTPTQDPDRGKPGPSDPADGGSVITDSGDQKS
ncbi:MtrAB system histidine kinase MtrB [Nocardia jinanensis]|uniref:MtrAB system histidine kinase MtrB n=1 Tax=Nocardia jinanensis TaxID=382504 RepID=UPI0012E35C81